MLHFCKFDYMCRKIFLYCSFLLLANADKNWQLIAQNNDEISKSRQNAITKTIELISSTVVGITVTEVREYRDPFFNNDPFFRQFFGNRGYKQEVKGLGSGVIISEDGYIVTNDHVAGNAKEIIVTLSNGEKLKAKLIGTDKISDVALLKIETQKLQFVKLGNSDDVLIGEWAIAFGNPFGLFENIDKPIVTVGVVSAKGMNFSIEDRTYRGMIQTDAVINSGNSGGPLVNAIGEVIGINTLIYTGGMSNTYIGYGFAIPVNKVKRIVEELKTQGKVSRSFWTGLEVNTVDARIARYFGLTKTEGVIISDIEIDSPGSKAGLQVGDIIVLVNNEKINDENSIIGIFRDSRVGETVTLSVYRDKILIKVPLTIERSKT
ncbi:MAG: trypsin-like serine protease [Ignavibacteria bacterium]|nr:trypsin-like serine protease [Bacteroidota bacterium]MSQ45824.1 trypsin-like serine protease [Ignavibacteria bacterium]